MAAEHGDGERGGSRLALLLVGLIMVAASCGESSLTPTVTCQPQSQSCTNPAAGTYQTCSHPDGTVDYTAGGELCTCTPGNPLQCLLCAEIVTGHCGSDPAAGFADAGSDSCAATFSGGFSGTSSSCALSVLYAPSANVTSVRIKGTPISGTPYTWGVEFIAPGTLAVGTFQQTQGIQSWIGVSDGDSGMLPNWEATINSGPPLGDATLQITSMGPRVQADGQTFYNAAQGTWTANLVDGRSQTAPQPNVTATIAF